MQKTLALAVATLALLAALSNHPAAAQCKIPNCDVGDYRAMGMAIDGYLDYGLSCLRDVREVFEDPVPDCEGKENIFRVYNQLQPNSNGSWNKPPMSWVVNYFDTGHATSLANLKTYAANQLTPDYDLWGKELTSWLYWGPVPVLAAAYDEIADNDLRIKLRSLMQGHVGLLSLMSTGDRVLTPSMRTHFTQGASNASIGINYFLKDALEISQAPPVNLNNHGSWAYRITNQASHGYMSSGPGGLRDKFKQCFQTGSNVDWVVAKLNALKVTTRVKVHIWRYSNSDYATLMEKNVNGNGAPIFAVSRVGGTVHVLGHQSSNSSPQCYRSGNKIYTSFGNIPAPSTSTPLTYYVTIDAGGVTRVQ